MVDDFKSRGGSPWGSPPGGGNGSGRKGPTPPDIEEIIKNLPEVVGGSADLSGSNNTKTKHSVILKPANFNGNYIHYGVREHAMAGIMNGMALHGGIIPFGGTFLIFLDYCKPSLRLSALMGLKVIYIFS